MKIYGNTAIIGVDHGFGNMKTASAIFPTGIVAYDRKPYFSENVLTYQGKYYLIGTGHKEYRDVKDLDGDYYVLTLAALALELQKERLTHAKVFLATGLPLTWLMGQRQHFQSYLLQNNAVDFHFKGQNYHVEFAGAAIYPQGYAAIAESAANFDGVNVLADIGNGTLNLLTIIDGKPDPATMSTEACGVKDCAIAMRTALANAHSGAKVHDSIIERIIREGTANVAPEYLAVLTNAARNYTDALMRRIREYGYDPKGMRLYVVGGGGCLLRYFAEVSESVVINSDLHANAKGYEHMAYSALKKECEHR